MIFCVPFYMILTEFCENSKFVSSQQTFVGFQDVLKTSSRHVLKTFSTRLQRNNFTSWTRLTKTSWRRLEDVFKSSCKTFWRHLQDVLEDEKLLRWRHLQDVLKTYLEDVFRRLGGKQNVYWGYLCLTNLDVYLTNLYFTNLYLTNLRRIQNASLRTQ